MTTITLPRATVEQALEAMLNFPDDISDAMFESITALKAALAQKHDPVAHSGWVLREVLFDNGEPIGHREPQHSPAALAQQDEPVEPAAWEASEDGRTIQDNDFTHDVVLRVMGDFENDEQRVRYAKRIVDKLNAALAQQAEPVAADALTEPKSGDKWRVEWWNESCRMMLPAHAKLDSFVAYKNGTIQFTIKRTAA